MARRRGKQPTAPVATGPAAGERCAGCGHWSPGMEYGLDDNSGYCDRWERITSRTFWCDEFVSRDEYAQYQQELAQENEDWVDEDV